jgi:hypothetical protein
MIKISVLVTLFPKKYFSAKFCIWNIIRIFATCFVFKRYGQ